MVEASAALGRVQQSAETVGTEQQSAASSNPISEFVSGVWHGAVTNKVDGVTQLFGADVKHEEVKRGAVNQFAYTAGEITGDIADFVIMTKFAGRAIGKLAPEIAGKSAVVDRVLANPVGRSATIGATVGLFNGAVLTATKEGESGWNRLGRGVTDAATFATLGGVATKLHPMAAEGFVGRAKMNAISGGAAGVVNSQMDGWTHGRQAGLGETAVNTLGWAAGNVAFGEAFHGLGKAFPKLGLGDTSTVAGAIKLSAADEAALKSAMESAHAKAAAEKAGGTATEVRMPRETRMAVEPVEPVQPLQTAAAAEGAVAEAASAEAAGMRVRDTTRTPVYLEKGETLSMRELVAKNDPRVNEIMERYYAKLEKAFPLEGEIETPEVYMNYLKKAGGTWDMVVLRDKAGEIVGGIQYQIVDVGGQQINKAAWGEHIWLDQPARNHKNFQGLIQTAREAIKKNGGDVVFMEFNNPGKMTAAEREIDAAAGISPADREKIWGRTGIHVLVGKNGQIPEYGQPSMGEGEPPVDFLSIGFIAEQSLTGKTLPKGDYIKLLHAAHKTIPSVDVATDPTVARYTSHVMEMPGNEMTFVPLNALGAAREAAMKAESGALLQQVTEAQIKKHAAELKPAVIRAITEANPQLSERERNRLAELSARATAELWLKEMGNK